MKRFLKNLLLFSLPVILLLAYILNQEFSKEQKWSRINGNCPKAACLYHLIHNSAKNIDIAFVGSSRTLNAINDTNLTRRLGLHVANLGYCRFGRNLQYLICKDLFENQKPKMLFIEVGVTEDWYGHFDYGNIACGKDVLLSVSDGNPKFLRDVKTNAFMKLNLFQNKILGKHYDTSDCISGFYSETKPHKKLKKSGLIPANSKSTRRNSEIYLEKIIALCKQNNCAIFFHFLPNYGGHSFKPHYIDYYRKQGVVISGLPELDKSKYWNDISHFNRLGSAVYSEYIFNFIETVKGD